MQKRRVRRSYCFVNTVKHSVIDSVIENNCTIVTIFTSRVKLLIVLSIGLLFFVDSFLLS